MSLVVQAAVGAEAGNAAALTGVYQALPAGQALPSGEKGSGSPAEAPLLPFARQSRKDIEQEEDAFKLCQAIGPFRMMALNGTKIELVAAPGMIVMLFEDIPHGNLRTLYLNRQHLPKAEPSPNGDSIARFEGDTLVVDTTALTDRNWLNDSGARPSSGLRLTERIRPLQGGRFLEVSVRADDPKALAKPYTYTRYFERTDREIQDDVCVIESHWDCGTLCVK